jgi:hypothetical protein
VIQTVLELVEEVNRECLKLFVPREICSVVRYTRPLRPLEFGVIIVLYIVTDSAGVSPTLRNRAAFLRCVMTEDASSNNRRGVQSKTQIPSGTEQLDINVVSAAELRDFHGD